MTRLYIVSSHFLVGAALSIAEVRVIKSITPECLTMIHVNLYSYKIISSGNITCFRYGKGRQIFDMNKGDMLHLEGRDYCWNSCIEVGYRGYTNKYKNLPAQPASQPPVLQHFFYDVDPENIPSPMKALEKAHQISHDVLSFEIRENQDMLQQLDTAGQMDTVYQVSTYTGFFGAVLSLILGLIFIGMCVKCQRQKASNKHQAMQMKTFKVLKVEEQNEEESV